MAAASASKKKVAKKKKPVEPIALPAIPLSEVAAVILGTFGVFLALSLVSFHPADGTPSAEGMTRNWMGAVGAGLAAKAVAALGVPSLMLPLGCILLALTLFQHGALHIRWLRTLAGIGLTGFTCIFLAIYPKTILMDGLAVPAGGALGHSIASLLTGALATGGTVVVTLALIVLCLQFILGIEIGPVVLQTVRIFTGAAKVTGSAVALGAGAVGTAAASSAETLNARMQDALAARREELERRRLERETATRAEAASGAEGALPRKRPNKSSPPSADPSGAAAGAGAAKDDASSPLVVTHSPNPLLEPDDAPKSSRMAASTDPEDDDLDSDDDFSDDPADEVDEDAPLSAASTPSSSPSAQPRARKKAEPEGPKIIKSKYMDEGVTGKTITVPDPTPPGEYIFPATRLMKTTPPPAEGTASEEDLLSSARLLEEKLRDYGVEGRVAEIHPGPVITMYEYAPAPGVKVSKITNLSNDLALALKASSVRIVAPIPGKAAVGIEVPNLIRQTVFIREVLEHEEFRNPSTKLPIAMGKDIAGKPYCGDMARMPHLLVAGSTGTGKSVAVNSMLVSLFYAKTPEDLRLILVDPKMIEFSVYHDIPHLLTPVVTDPNKAAAALNWAVEEMERRYRLLTLEGARNIANYNGIMEEKLKTWDPETAPEGTLIPRKLPYIVIVIDELADLMMVAGKEVQDSIVRLAQKARAAGLHLIVATQRPSVDVITGLIKANFPARIAFKVASKTDSRTILDANGAEYLLGNGDMLHVPPGSASIMRLHGAFVSDDEARAVADHLRAQGKPRYEESLLAHTTGDAEDKNDDDDDDRDEKYEEAKAIVLETGLASISTIQRRLKIGYNRSARMVERMAKEGLVGPPTQGGKPREVYVAKLQASLR